MVGAGRSKRTHSGKRGALESKRKVVTKFRARHIDQVWQDVRKPQGVHSATTGPLGTTDAAALDEDLPAHGRFYCTACARYFMGDAALATHAKGKPHKKRVKALAGPQPHNQRDAEWAAGVGAPDNGPRRAAAAAAPMDAA
jgi:bud site selection protein 20